MALPKYFCWTRYGTESGESFEHILDRKERERRNNGGIFLWGIGNAIGPSVALLVQSCDNPVVAFSPTKSPPRACDVSPQHVARWTAAETVSGQPYPLPKHSVVRSRFDCRKPKRTHYALVCFSTRRLELGTGLETLALDQLQNLISGRPLGASQVTAVVSRQIGQMGGTTYPVTMLAELRAPYFIKLKGPLLETEATLRSRLDAETLAPF